MFVYVALIDTEFFASVAIFNGDGTTSNYFLDNRINRVKILFPGVGCFLVVVCLASTVHSSNAADNKEKLEGFSSKEGCLGKALSLDCPYVSLLVFAFLYSHQHSTWQQMINGIH
ncbi:ureide permease 3-like [Humulus lupulus]|uniref:ureide permease 3-like n=1 Tax=Humulus lupulus TaxID=3486 RepID=UPI002B40FD1B|nr:ureide permease 3-like [Humulus lupulus]